MKGRVGSSTSNPVGSPRWTVTVKKVRGRAKLAHLTPPAPEVVSKQDETQTREEFLRDLRKVTRRTEPS